MTDSLDVRHDRCAMHGRSLALVRPAHGLMVLKMVRKTHPTVGNPLPSMWGKISRYRRATITGGTYFFTVVTFRRQAFLCDEPVRNALRNAVLETRAVHPFTIDGWVLLPDHSYSIWTWPLVHACPPHQG
ncbi:hypothetical protein [Desulforhabdus sp. TSK]|uniref:hypothetical protein n=1 Tax=Desulforhabdus sp. TSK TaxID=2925014 RepID=UPI001FC8E758|nr:hypothetical protein [Desulforhabdus sp. TSK]